MGTDRATDGGVQITQWLLEVESLEEFLQTLVETARDLTGVEGTGVTLERNRRPLTVASAGPPAPKLDEKQYDQDDGPCLRSLRNSEEIVVGDMLSEERFGDYPAYAAASGIRSSLSLPIAVGPDTAGALNFYAAEPEAFKDTDVTGLRSLAAQAAGGIALAQRIMDARDLAEQMQTAMRSRSVIDQAMGVIMGQRRCTADEAFRILRSASQHRNIKIRDLCTELITNLTGESPTAPEPGPRP